jgi:hypothetical protein
MPNGCYIILLLSESEYKVLGYYFKQKPSNFEVTGDLYLRLNLDHSKNEYTLIKLKENQLLSYFYKFQSKLSRKALGIMFGVLINETDDLDKLRVSLKNAAPAMENSNILDISKENFELKLKGIYHQYLETLIDIIDADALKESIINRTKEMLSGSSKERKLAQELLEKIENKVHTKIGDYYRSAEDALKVVDYEKASKFFNKAAEVAEELMEEELVKSLQERAKLSFNIPDLLKKRENIIKEAKNALRNDNFHSAYIFFLRAAEISKELMDSEREEEYTLKSKALQDIYLFEERLKKKK